MNCMPQAHQFYAEAILYSDGYNSFLPEQQNLLRYGLKREENVFELPFQKDRRKNV